MGIRLAGVVLTVRAIGPSAYGIYSAAAVFVLFAATMAQMGAEVYLIRLPGSFPLRRFHEAFTFLLCSSLLVTAVGEGITFLVAPWLRPVGVVLPLRVLLLCVPLNILWAPAQARIERSFGYRRMGFLELGGDVALYGTAVPLALMGWGPWSLVAGYFAWQGWLFFGSLVLSGLRPRFAWSNQTAREMLHHGWTYSLSTWLLIAQSGVAVLVVGSFAGAAGVGLVTFAQRLVTTLNFSQRGLQRVGIVAIARAGQPAPGRLSRAMEEGSLLLMLVVAAPFAAFGLVAHWVVPGVFGNAWTPAIPVYVLLVIVAVLGVPSQVQCTLLFAYGRNLPVALATGMELVGLGTASVLLVHAFGLVGFGYASLVILASTVYTHFAAARYAIIRYRRLIVPLAGLVPPTLAPVIPLPWAFLTVIPVIALVVLPSTRQELRGLAATLRAVLRRRTGAAEPPVPSEVVPAEVVPAEVVQTTAPASPLPVAGARPNLFPPITWVPDRVPVARQGGADVKLNGSLAPGVVRLPSRQPARANGTAERQLAGSAPAAADPLQALLAPADAASGTASLSLLLARTGRLLGGLAGGAGSLLVAAYELSVVDGVPLPPAVVVAATDGLRAELRFDDLLAKVAPALFVVVAPLAPGGADGRTVAGHLHAAIGRSVSRAAGQEVADRLVVQVAHLVATTPHDEEADQLVRRVVEAAHGR